MPAAAGPRAPVLGGNFGAQAPQAAHSRRRKRRRNNKRRRRRGTAGEPAMPPLRKGTSRRRHHARGGSFGAAARAAASTRATAPREAARPATGRTAKGSRSRRSSSRRTCPSRRLPSEMVLGDGAVLLGDGEAAGQQPPPQTCIEEICKRVGVGYAGIYPPLPPASSRSPPLNTHTLAFPDLGALLLARAHRRCVDADHTHTRPHAHMRDSSRRELASIKEDQWRRQEDHVSRLWGSAVERNDRSWVKLLCFLLAVAVALLSLVEYRIDRLSGGIDRVKGGVAGVLSGFNGGGAAVEDAAAVGPADGGRDTSGTGAGTAALSAAGAPSEAAPDVRAEEGSRGNGGGGRGNASV
eukprot:365937-Chlamydomonas_euryale.AAC.1